MSLHDKARMQMERSPDTEAVAPALPAMGGWQDEPGRRLGHSTLRLQPVVLGPPPDPSFRDVSAEDDLDLRDLAPTRNTGLIAGLAAACIALTAAGVAYFMLSSGDRASKPPPAIIQASPEPLKQAPPQAEIEAAKPVTEAAAPVPVASSPATPVPQNGATSASQTSATDIISVTAPSENPEMGGIQSELVPPQTDGLSPARRVQAIRIRVENDQELLPAR
jgi:hypothetical protein